MTAAPQTADRAVILADIGGTHVRFARLQDGAVQDPVKYAAASYKTILEALAAYQSAPGTVLIATAARHEADGVWRFHNNNDWLIDPAALRAVGWDAPLIVNDFKASARGVVARDNAAYITLHAGPGQPDAPRLVLGAGTGLGLAVLTLLPDARWHVQETFGGHMVTAALTDEHRALVRIMAILKDDGRAIVPEDIVSGRAMPLLYQAVCQLHGYKLQPYEGDMRALVTAESVANDPALTAQWRLFHEFLGLFAHQAAIATHGFGGLYLDGGLTQALHTKGLFDTARFMEFFVPDVAPVVKAALQDTPVRLVIDPFIALSGLAAYAAEGAL